MPQGLVNSALVSLSPCEVTAVFVVWTKLTVDWELCEAHVAGGCLGHLPALLGLLRQHVEVLGDVAHGVIWQGGLEVEVWVDGGGEDRSTEC